ncbi:MAG: ribbon-helix-helix protein, CopG family [Pyrinomonadaceae bacterium]|jgi:metal-responsive CopG/Arc/MetJ family transcriptional regulator|nr:ribbon-helix-helix protein, CopG family [Pyrinomonadaceae bacterium]
MELAKKISISLPKDLLARIDELVGKSRKRSTIIESALREYISKENSRELNQKEIEILNANAEKLNEEALDVLEYQEVNW